MVGLTFYATIVWAIGYWVVYPAWPTLDRLHQGHVRLSANAPRVADEVKAARRPRKRHARPARSAPPRPRSQSDPDLLRFAMAGGAAAFQTNCAPCHGRGAQGFVGYPNLNDDDWIWGGTHRGHPQTISFGVRSRPQDARASQMPRFGLDSCSTTQQIGDVGRVCAVAFG